MWRGADISEKVILTDCDGVLLDWEYGFYNWMREKGYEPKKWGQYSIHKAFDLEKDFSKSLVRHFNESANIGYLPPYKDAIKYVRKLHEEFGYVFHCITSLSLNPYAKALRRKNLETLFGVGVFEKIVCLDCGADKDEALKPYLDSDCIWVEDKPENAIAGLAVGLDSYLIHHPHNKDFNSPSIRRIKNWQDLYEAIV